MLLVSPGVLAWDVLRKLSSCGGQTLLKVTLQVRDQSALDPEMVISPVCSPLCSSAFRLGWMEDDEKAKLW